MKYAVVETAGDWIVQRDSQDLARFRDQIEALAYVADLLRACEDPERSYSLTMRYLLRA